MNCLSRLSFLRPRRLFIERVARNALVLVALLLVQSPLYAEESGEQRARFQAYELWEAGYLLHLAGRYQKATDAFRESIRHHPTAEAHTYLGWSLSYMGRLGEAIEECKKAIRLDPDLGNPYNDIGVYLMEFGRFEEAVPWFKKAIGSQRYCCYHYAHTNLGEILVRQGRLLEARRSFRRALEYAPDYPPALQALETLGGQGETL